MWLGQNSPPHYLQFHAVYLCCEKSFSLPIMVIPFVPSKCTEMYYFSVNIGKLWKQCLWGNWLVWSGLHHQWQEAEKTQRVQTFIWYRGATGQRWLASGAAFISPLEAEQRWIKPDPWLRLHSPHIDNEVEKMSLQAALKVDYWDTAIRASLRVFILCYQTLQRHFKWR